MRLRKLPTDLGKSYIDLDSIIGIIPGGGVDISEKRCTVYLLGQGRQYWNVNMPADDVAEMVKYEGQDWAPKAYQVNLGSTDIDKAFRNLLADPSPLDALAWMRIYTVDVTTNDGPEITVRCPHHGVVSQHGELISVEGLMADIRDHHLSMH